MSIPFSTSISIHSEIVEIPISSYGNMWDFIKTGFASKAPLSSAKFHVPMKRRRACTGSLASFSSSQNSGLIVLILAIALFPVSYTLRILVRQFQCQVCIDHDLATYLTDCRTDPFAVLDSPRCGRAAAEEGLYSFEALDQVLLLRRHLLRFLPRLHFKVFLHCHLHCHHRIASTFISSHNHKFQRVLHNKSHVNPRTDMAN